MEGFIPGRKSCSSQSVLVLALCLGSFLFTFVASSVLPFLQHFIMSPSQSHPVSQLCLQSNRGHNTFTGFWSPSGSRNVNHHHHHRVVHEYQPRPNPFHSRMTTNCETRRVPGHRFHLPGTRSGNNVPVTGIVCYHFPVTTSATMNVSEHSKPTPGGQPAALTKPSADDYGSGWAKWHVDDIVDRPTLRGHPPPPPSRAKVIVEMLSLPLL